MKKKIFWILAGVILLLGLIIRLYAIKNNNLYFTVDQGRDALYIREIIERGRIFLKGPETNIRGVFAGPLVDYFFAIGYLILGGHPFGSALMIIFLNLATTLFLMLWLKKKVGGIVALIVGALLQFFWGFFQTSLWGFHPFVLVGLAFSLILLLAEFLGGKRKYFYLGLIPIFLAFNSEVAGATALYIFFALVGLWGVRKNLLPIKKYVLFVLGIPAIGALILAKQFLSQLVGSKISGDISLDVGKSGMQVFSGTNFGGLFWEFINIIGSVTIPQNTILGVAVFIVIIGLFWFHQKKLVLSVKNFVYLVLMLTCISFVFFASNRGWRSWHTVYLPPLLFTTMVLILLQIPKRIGVGLLLVILVFQLVNFKNNYFGYLAPSSNASILSNQLSTVDWIYQNAEDQGFAVFNYTNTFYDQPYQYLFWWYGLAKYKYLPCEYSNFPRSIKSLYVPGYEFYLEPKRECTKIKFLIIQSTTNGEINKDWIIDYKTKLDLVSQTQIGDIKVEKYYVKPSQPCIIWNTCQ